MPYYVPGTVSDTGDKAGNLKHNASALMEWSSHWVVNKWGDRVGTVVCPTLDRMVRESLFETEQKNSSSEEQSQVDIFGKGVEDRGWKDKPQMQRS